VSYYCKYTGTNNPLFKLTDGNYHSYVSVLEEGTQLSIVPVSDEEMRSLLFCA
jgi:predicted RNA-binding protein with PUA-like domain